MTTAYKMVTAGISEKSIAVLPLENLTEEKENAYFADGIQDELLSNLAKIKDLKVISRIRSCRRRWDYLHSRRLRKLGVSKVVEGSVRRSGNHIRVSVQLIDALTDRHIWSENYDRTLADSLALQGDLSYRDRCGCGRNAESTGEDAREGQAHEQSCCLRCISACPRVSSGSHRGGCDSVISRGSEIGSEICGLAWALYFLCVEPSYWVGKRSKPRAAGGS